MSFSFSYSIMQLSKTKRSHDANSCPAIFDSYFSNCIYFGQDYFLISSSRRVEEIEQFGHFLPSQIWIISPTGSTNFCHLSKSQYNKVRYPNQSSFRIFVSSCLALTLIGMREGTLSTLLGQIFLANHIKQSLNIFFDQEVVDVFMPIGEIVKY